MNAQFKKGVLELIVLAAVEQKDMYGYELVAEVSKVVNVKEGTIYPILKRLTNEHYFETYLRESTEGPPRKYYHLTAAGILHFIGCVIIAFGAVLSMTAYILFLFTYVLGGRGAKA